MKDKIEKWNILKEDDWIRVSGKYKCKRYEAICSKRKTLKRYIVYQVEFTTNSVKSGKSSLLVGKGTTDEMLIELVKTDIVNKLLPEVPNLDN